MCEYNTEKINEEICELWKRHFGDNENVHMPMQYPALKKDALLFVGLNPSFSDKFFSQLGKKMTSCQGIDHEEFYEWPRSKKYDPQKDYEITKFAKEEYPYSRKFRDISKELGMEWEHIDLFFNRCTSQKDSQKEFTRQKNKEDIELTEFALKQIALSTRLISEICPKIIVVANALASDIYLQYMKPEPDELAGHHFTNINGKKVPIFLASMLTGQRAMDKYSLDRLTWHIKRAFGLHPGSSSD
ncbi:MAG TPA: hypothetical protein PLV42_01820 [bacterium]|nr:hypothetical protein [bacterium]